jgi:CPA2 family monovalent cation:H+ antiporter-2
VYLIIAGAIITFLVNPFYFVAVTYLKKRLQIIDRTVLTKTPPPEEPEEIPETTLTDHAVIVGYGRVGTILGARLKAENQPYLVIEDRKQTAETIRQSGIEVVQGNAADPRVIRAANIPGARWLFIAIPDGFEAGQVAEQARKLNSNLDIIARAHSDAEVEHLEKHKANFVIMGEREIAYGMLEHAFGAFPAEPKPDNSEAQPS